MLDNLKSRLKGKVIILGIGNTLRSDDGAGSILANRIRNRSGFFVFDAGMNPENYLAKIVKEKPDTLVIIDAVDFGGSAGQIRLFSLNQIQEKKFYSTHNLSLNLLINFLLKNKIKNIMVLAIQPKEIKLGKCLSREMRNCLKILEELFIKWSN